MQYTIDELRHKIFQPVYDVYEVFQNFFGEEAVDLQNMPPDEYLLPNGVSMEELPSYDISNEMLVSLVDVQRNVRPHILVYWPRVRVTNEHDKYIDIQDLYAKVTIDTEGCIPYECTGFELIRTTFPEDQFTSGYIHSHVPRFYDAQIHFQSPCLGRGPIRHTISDLKNNSEEALWMLFCQELSLYVTVESLAGGPYFRLEEVANLGRKLQSDYTLVENEVSIRFLIRDCVNHNYDLKWTVNEFLKYYLSDSNNLPICYKDKEFKCGLPYFDFMITISNAFIEWVNQNGDANMVSALYSADVLNSVFVSQGRFYTTKDLRTRNNILTETVNLLTFKGRDIPLRVISVHSTEEQSTVTLLNHNLAMFILHKILRTINYHYGNEYNNTGEESSITPTHQAVCYL